ncbi:MAG: CtsR family transcriptional regulator [Clostridia bacterium]|nr:CtsR family transcriptional regulator [Clostridia bacterium]
MARLSDQIENFLKELFKDAENSILEIQRNELAEYFNCAPSQINYVLATRFTLDKGYYIESRRGGGGFIKIARLDIDDDDYLLHLVSNRIGAAIPQNAAIQIVESLYEQELITEREMHIIKSAITDKAINAPSAIKDNIRAGILRNVLISIMSF